MTHAATQSANVVIVTGGSRGIGAATAVAAARRDFDVGVGYRDRQDRGGRRRGAVRAAVVTSPHTDAVTRLFSGGRGAA